MKSNGKIFWASFLTLIAAGMGFAVRATCLAEWGDAFGFTKTDLGTITGGGLTGMAFTIIGFSLFADRIGYKLILIGAFVLHLSLGRRHLGGHARLRSLRQERHLLVPVHRHVHVLAGQRHVRGRDQSAGGHALSQKENALPEYPARRLAGWFDPGRAVGLVFRRAELRRSPNCAGKSR